MTTLTTISGLALTASGVLGTGVSPSATDQANAAAMVAETIQQMQNVSSLNVVRPGYTLPGFPDPNTDVPFWTQWQDALVWATAVRLRALYNRPASPTIEQMAERTGQIFQANSRNALAAQSNTDTTPQALVLLALRAAGRVNDTANVNLLSQDYTDGLSLFNEMIDEWTLQRAVSVTPGTFPATYGSDVAAFSPAPGVRSAIIWGLSIRLRELTGAKPSETQLKLAADSLAVVQANNKGFQPPLVAGPVNTPAGVIQLALRHAKRVSDTQSVALGSADFNDAFSHLTAMMGVWDQERWLSWDLRESIVQSTGAASYSIGPGCDFDCTRTADIEAVMVRFGSTGPGYGGTLDATTLDNATLDVGSAAGGANAVDWGRLRITLDRADWNAIPFKSAQGLPGLVFLDSGWPTGTVYFYPVPPSGQYELHLWTKSGLPTWADVNEPLGLPPEYIEALVYNLAMRLPDGQPSAAVARLAAASLQTIRAANFQIPLLQMPPELSQRRSGDLAWLFTGGTA